MPPINYLSCSRLEAGAVDQRNSSIALAAAVFHSPARRKMYKILPHQTKTPYCPTKSAKRHVRQDQSASQYR